MKITLKTGILFAFAWIILRYVLFLADPFENQSDVLIPSVMANILFVLLSIAIGLYLHKKKNPEKVSAMQDIKSGMSAGVPYTILVSIFLYFFYSSINPEFNKHQIAEAEFGIQELLNNPKEFEELKRNNQDYEVKTKDEIYKSMIQGPRSIYTPQATMTISLLALLLLSTIYSIFIAIVFRKLIFR